MEADFNVKLGNEIGLTETDIMLVTDMRHYDFASVIREMSTTSKMIFRTYFYAVVKLSNKACDMEELEKLDLLVKP